jgi:PTH2 family peptidyl-tRNA hydrolase
MHCRAPKSDLQLWYQRGAAKIALKCTSQEDLLALEAKASELGLTNYVVCDAGRTQIAAGSMTVLAVGPAPASKVDLVAGHLKLM